MPRKRPRATKLSASPFARGKRPSEGCGGGSRNPRGRSLIRTVQVNGERRRALIDTGCSVTLVSSSVANCVTPKSSQMVSLELMDGRSLVTRGAVCMRSVLTEDGVELGPVEAQVVPSLPAGVDVVLGLDIIYKTGLTISPGTEANPVSFKPHHTGLSVTPTYSDDPVKVIHDPDFLAEFSDGEWSVRWTWKPHQSGGDGGKGVAFASPEDRKAFDEEVASWIREGVLVEHDRNLHGEVCNFLPMFGVRQTKGETSKVRPVFDFRVLNSKIESHPGGATPLCADRLRQWRQQ